MTDVRRTLPTKPGRNTRLMALPVWSGPSENRNVAVTSCLRRISTRFGTPSRVPRRVSTSIFSARNMDTLFDQAPRLGDLTAISLENTRERVLHADHGLPVKIGAGVGDLRNAILHVLIALAVIFRRGGLRDGDARSIFGVFRIFLCKRQHFFRELPHRPVVSRIADVVYLAGGNSVLVRNDPDEGRNTVVDVGE